MHTMHTVADVLKGNDTLQVLDLHRTYGTPGGGRGLLEALETNTTLWRLCIAYNNDDETQCEVDALLDRREDERTLSNLCALVNAPGYRRRQGVFRSFEPGLWGIVACYAFNTCEVRSRFLAETQC